jgi:hypothetical protein
MSKRNQVRLVMLIPAALVGSLILSFIHASWASFWLVKDSSQTKAIFVSQLSHGVVQYRYMVGGSEYSGQSQRGQNESGMDRPGDEGTVNFSKSHPWLSSLQKPSFPPGGIPVLLVALVFEFFFVATIINPKGRWALQTGLKENE